MKILLSAYSVSSSHLRGLSFFLRLEQKTICAEPQFLCALSSSVLHGNSMRKIYIDS